MNELGGMAEFEFLLGALANRQSSVQIESKVYANTQGELQIMKFTGKCFVRLTLHRSLAKTHVAFKNIKVEPLSPFCVIALVSFSVLFFRENMIPVGVHTIMTTAVTFCCLFFSTLYRRYLDYYIYMYYVHQKTNAHPIIIHGCL